MSWTAYMRIMRENRQIAKTGTYRSADGRAVTIAQPVQALAANTALLLPDSVQAQTVSRRTPFSVDADCMHSDTIGCVLRLSETVSGEIIALNFANAMYAGGGYILGGDAQEESLCRASLLYPVLSRQKSFYRWHRLHPTPLYSSRMLLSPDVPIIRSSDGRLLSVPVPCTFLTCAAVNRRFAKLCMISEKRINAAMQARINGIVQAMALRRPAAVVLGAFGCGVFGNRRETVFPMIEAAVNRYIPDETRAVFAAP